MQRPGGGKEHAEPSGGLRLVCLLLLRALTCQDILPVRRVGSYQHRQASEGPPRYTHGVCSGKLARVDALAGCAWRTPLSPGLPSFQGFCENKVK